MRCTSPRTVGFRSDGKTLCWSPKDSSKQFATFQIPCGKCLSCRLEYARQWAVRCVHEAQMHPTNSFVTLTYDEKHLKSAKLVYTDFQTFVKDLRSKLFANLLNELFPNLNQRDQRKLWNKFPKERKNELYSPIQISIFVTGEYGDKNKRPHWHALIFNWSPPDATYLYTSDNEDKVYESKILQELWPHGKSEFGSVTFKSAGYCARYAAKKLTHGKDDDHDYEPISKKSSQNAIGKSFVEKYWKDIFNRGQVFLPDGTPSSIPRYYEKWLKKHHPDEFARYVTQTKNKFIEEAINKEKKISLEEKKINFARSARQGLAVLHQISRNKTRERILKKKFDELQKHLKL